MAEDFNIRDNSWDSFFPHYSIHSNLLTDIADFMNLCISKSTNQVLTRYSDNQDDSNLTINLMFLRPNSSELDNHTIYLEQRLLFNYAPLTVNIIINYNKKGSTVHGLLNTCFNDTDLLLQKPQCAQISLNCIKGPVCYKA